MKLLAALLLSLLPAAGPAAAEDVRSEKYQRPGSAQARQLPRPEPKAWDASAGLSFISDANISHLLVNSAVDSDKKVRDNIRRLYADLSVEPAFAKAAGLELSYSHDDYAYRTHKTFSYRTNSFSASAAPGLGAGFSLDLGADLDLTSDKSGTIAEDAAAHAGLAWRAPGGLRLKGGCELRRDNVRTNPLKDAENTAFYLSANRRLGARQLAFLNLRAQDHAAAGNNYGYASLSASAGLISKWTDSLKLVSLVSLGRRDYDHTDTRFLKRRSDSSASLTLKPSLRLAPWLYATGSFAYMENRSNVSMKSFTDRIYSAGLEARF